MVIAETKRLYLRPLVPGDAPWFYALNEQEVVIKYTGDKPFTTLKEAYDFLVEYEITYRSTHMGRWAVMEKATEKPLGWAGLKKHTNGEVDLGFRFFKSYWNKGFATESGKVCLHYGFRKLGLREIIANARRENLNSIRVLNKLGFQFNRSFMEQGHPWNKYIKSA